MAPPLEDLNGQVGIHAGGWMPFRRHRTVTRPGSVIGLRKCASLINRTMPGLIEWGGRELGAERLLFGSDTPLYHVALQRARIDAAELLILRENALKLFNLSQLPSSGRFTP